MKNIVIIGGGITGLATAYYLKRRIAADQLSANIVLVEGGDSLGGKISTLRQGEYIMETGADSVVSRKTNMAPLLEELGLQDELVYNATGKSYIYADGRLKLIPKDSVFGIPLSIESLASSELVSAEGKIEALKDWYTPINGFTKTDSIGRFLEACFGKELVEKQIAPVLSGVYSGELSELTIASTLPYLLDYKSEYGSIMQGLHANRDRFLGGGDKKFYSFKNGLSVLVERIAEAISPMADIRLGTKAERIAALGQSGRYAVQLANGDSIEADSIVISTLHPAAQALLHSSALDEQFNQLRGSSLTSVYIGFDVDDEQLPMDGTGFITADNRELQCNACTWTSRKWAHTSAEGRLLVRLFYKSANPGYAALAELDEQELLDVALRDVKIAMGIDAKPLYWNVTKWNDTMPNYHIRHPHVVAALEQQMAEQFPNVLLAGCSYYGVGIPDCIASGERTAAAIAERLR